MSHIEEFRFKPQDLAVMNAPNGAIIAKMDKKNLISLMNLKTITNTVNDIYKHDETIDNITNDTTNTKDVNNHFVNIQNGFRIVGKDYKFSNHMNKGYEEFGLMVLDDDEDDVWRPCKCPEGYKCKCVAKPKKNDLMMLLI